MRSVVDNFLATFKSRNTDFDGYWAYGFIIERMRDELQIDLINQNESAVSAAEGMIISLARNRFVAQVAKARLDLAFIQNALLVIRNSGTRGTCWINDSQTTGSELILTVEVIMDNDRRYSGSETICVAQHDASRERRSTRAGAA